MAIKNDYTGEVYDERTIDIYGDQDGAPMATIGIDVNNGEVLESLGANTSQLKFDINDGKIVSITDDNNTKLNWEVIGDYDYPAFLWEDKNIFTDEVKQTTTLKHF